MKFENYERVFYNQLMEYYQVILEVKKQYEEVEDALDEEGVGIGATVGGSPQGQMGVPDSRSKKKKKKKKK